MVPNRRVLNAEEQAIHNGIIQLSRDTDKAVEEAWQCLRDLDIERARQLISQDSRINDLHRRTEQECIIAIARQQPVASDLRDLIAAMYIGTELERIADHAADIAKIVLRMSCAPSKDFSDLLEQLARKCRQMLSEVMLAFERCDAQRAREVAAEDNVVDRMEKELVQAVFSCMRESPEQVPPCTHLLWVTHNFERIGDRVTNIAERIVFMRSGEYLDLNR